MRTRLFGFFLILSPLLLAACAPSPPSHVVTDAPAVTSPTPLLTPVPLTTPTPYPYPVTPENCAPLVTAQDGNLSPVVCPDGHPNLAAIRFFASLPSHLLALPNNATATQVEAAACADLNAPAPNAGTIPLVTTEAALAFAEHHWNFAGVTSPTQINQYLTSGACSS